MPPVRLRGAGRLTLVVGRCSADAAGIVRSPLAGDFLVRQAQHLLETQMGINVVPAYLVAAKEAVAEGEPAQFRCRQYADLTDSFKQYMVHETIRDFIASAAYVVNMPYNERYAG